MTLIVETSDDPTRARLLIHDQEYRCAIGAGGATNAKREGDQCTPLGDWRLRRVFYRQDRVIALKTAQPLVVITGSMGWCDDPRDSKQYNRLVTLPYAGSHETLWREDGLYDIVVELGYNDDPPVPGLGSAIFMHVARPDFAPTQGCVALRLDDLRALLEHLEAGAIMTIRLATTGQAR
jgi:L,D-peptidoglycan transpeptidase YkuD (ErfK/YbiS/YcfS/YnhG family)